MDYRKAKCIELHDAQIALTTYEESYVFTNPTGRVAQATRPAYKLHFEAEFNIEKVYDDESEQTDSKIVSLECQVLSSHLVNIRTSRDYGDGHELFVEEITYSGSFTVWWEPERAKTVIVEIPIQTGANYHAY